MNTRGDWKQDAKNTVTSKSQNLIQAGSDRKSLPSERTMNPGQATIFWNPGCVGLKHYQPTSQHQFAPIDPMQYKLNPLLLASISPVQGVLARESFSLGFLFSAGTLTLQWRFHRISTKRAAQWTHTTNHYPGIFILSAPSYLFLWKNEEWWFLINCTTPYIRYSPAYTILPTSSNVKKYTSSGSCPKFVLWASLIFLNNFPSSSSRIHLQASS